MPQVQKPLCLIRFWVIPFFSFSPLWDNKKWDHQYEDEEVGKFREQNWLNRLQMVQFECPRHSKPCVLLRLGEFPFPIFCPCSFLPSSLHNITKWFIIGGWVKSWNFFETKLV